MSKLIKYDDDAILGQLCSGMKLRDIAKQIGITKQSLHTHISKHPQYLAAKQEAFDSRLDDCEDELRRATDATDIARAREVFRATAWRAERECPSIWGKQDTNNGTSVTVVIDTSCGQARVIDHGED